MAARLKIIHNCKENLKSKRIPSSTAPAVGWGVLDKLRLSNHKLAIETGRYSRPFKKTAERTCPICKLEMEDEYHFLNICPAYQEKRSSLLDYLENEYRIKISRMSPNRIFMFLINPPSGNVRIQKLIAKHIFKCFEKRKGEEGKVNTQGLLSPWVFT